MDQRKNDTPKSAPAPAVSAELYNNASCGLSRKEARSRYRAIGRNTLFDRDSARKKPFFFVIFKDPSVLVFLFLVFLALLFAPLSAGIFALVGFLGAIFYPLWIQRLRKRTEAAFDRFRMPQVGVIRDGRLHSIRADHVVLGDLLSLKAGDVVPADCRLLAADALRVLDVRRTYEGKLLSRIVTKRALPQELVGRSDDFNSAEELLRGVSEILEGEALAVVIATGEDTCWRRESYGYEVPSEYHCTEGNEDCVARAADSALMVNTLMQFVAFFLFLIVQVLIYKSDEDGLVATFLSLGALVCVGATSLLRSLLSSFESKWRETRMRSTDPQCRAILKSNSLADRLVGVTDVFVMGREALALLQNDPASGRGLSALQRACRERKICLSVFLDKADPTSSFPKNAPTDVLYRLGLNAKEAADLTEYIGKYCVFCGFAHENVVKLAVSLRRQGRRVAVISERADDGDLLSLASLAVGIADLFDDEQREKNDERARTRVQAPPMLLRHADLLIAPTSRSSCSLVTLLALRDDAHLLLTRGMAAIRFLSLSQLSALFFVGFSCLFGLALPTAFSIFYGVGFLQTVGTLWLSSSFVSSQASRSTALRRSRLMKDITAPAFWASPAITSLLCVVVSFVLHLLGIVTLEGAGALLFCSLLFVQLCGLLLTALQSGLTVSLKGFLLPLCATLLPALILGAFCVAFDGVNRLLGLGNWSAVTLCLLPLAPVSYFAFTYLFLRFFYRTAK